MKSTDKPTPGPWEVACESGQWFVTDTHFAPLPETMPNARLIATSPDMFEAIQYFLNALYFGHIRMADTAQARNAEQFFLGVWRKATGETGDFHG